MIAKDLERLAVPLDDLVSLAGNPRRGDVEAVKRSYERFGQRKAIVARHLPDGRCEVTAGNTQLAAARELGWPALAVVWCDEGDDEAHAWALADNRTSELGAYDQEALLAYLQEVALVGDAELLAATGYDETDLARLLGRFSTVGDPEEIPEPPETARSSRGDLWLLGRHRLLCGDATEPGDVERLMAGERAWLMATDPPYLVDYDGSNHPQSTVNSAMTKDKAWDEYRDPVTGAAFFVAYLEAALPWLHEAVPVYQWHADKRRGMVEAAWEKAGVFIHQGLVWVKSRPVLTRSDFMWQSECCLYGWRKGHRPGRTRRPPANQPNVWRLDQKSANEEHPTEKPLELFTDPYTWHLQGGELGYEPFSGSGTAIIAAEVTGRRCNAMEIEPRYVDVACRRFQRTTGEQPVLEATGEKVDFDA